MKIDNGEEFKVLNEGKRFGLIPYKIAINKAKSYRDYNDTEINNKHRVFLLACSEADKETVYIPYRKEDIALLLDTILDNAVGESEKIKLMSPIYEVLNKHNNFIWGKKK